MILAIIGLIADVTGIYSISKGMELVASKNGQQTILIIGILIIVYAWIAIAWFMTIRNIEKKTTLSNHYDVSLQSVIPVGIVLAPIFFALLVTVDSKNILALSWVYLLVFSILSVNLGLLMDNIYPQKTNETDFFNIQTVQKIFIAFAISFVFGGLFVGLATDKKLGKNHAVNEGKYTCDFPYNSQWIHIKQGQKVAVTYDYAKSMYIITDSIGYFDKAQANVLETYFSINE